MPILFEAEVRRVLINDLETCSVNVVYVPVLEELAMLVGHGADLDYTGTTIEAVSAAYLPTAAQAMFDYIDSVFPGEYTL
jgi:hypothetical protein